MPLRQLFPDPKSFGEAPKVDIIAVHGLNPKSKPNAEHALDTWRTPSGPKGHLWLREDLPQHVPGARIFTYEYNATVLYGKDRDAFVGKASELLEAIRVERDEEEDHSIIFLCHSMGGLLVEQALVNAHNNPKYAPIKDLTSGLIFFATPQKGGKDAQVALGKMVSQIAQVFGLQKGPGVMDVLSHGSIFSEILQEHWRHQLLEYDIVSFWGSSDDIVERDSAQFGLPGYREHVAKLRGGHKEVCKFGTTATCQENMKIVGRNISDVYKRALKKRESLASLEVVRGDDVEMGNSEGGRTLEQLEQQFDKLKPRP